MSIDLANIRMLRALRHSFADEAETCGDDRNALLLARVSKACGDAADELERNPIGQPDNPGQFGKTERLDNSET